MKAISEVVHSDAKIMSGVPVFVGTRVPLQNLLDYLDGGHPLADFLEEFPSVTKEQAISALRLSFQGLMADARSA